MTKKKIELTPDKRYIIVNGRRWRATNPNLTEDERRRLVSELMRARRDVGRALKTSDKTAEAEARARVHAAKIALGERGEKWWEKEDAEAVRAYDEAKAANDEAVPFSEAVQEIEDERE